MWLSTVDEPQGAMWSPAYLIMLYSLIFRLIKSWLVTVAFCKEEDRDRKVVTKLSKN